MNFQAVLFDLDGTLLDTLDDLADSTNLALSKLGLPEHPAEAYKEFIGDGIENLVRRAVPADRRDSATLAESGWCDSSSLKEATWRTYRCNDLRKSNIS
jgi:phosphoglycolate phosphatase-like HAD superfamily hydrolase